MADKKITQLPAAATPLAGSEVLPLVQGGITEQVSVANLTAGRDVTMGNAAVGGAISGSYKLAVYGAITSTLGANYFAGTLGIGTTPAYALDVARGGGAQLLLRAGQSGVSNGFTIISNGTNLTYQFDDGNVKIGTAGKGIDFSANANAPGMTSELLTWYEEGTWTPTLVGGTTAGDYTVATTSAKYTRIGRQVTVTAGMVITVNSAGTGVAKFGGLPFAKGADQFLSGSVYTSSVSYGAGVLSVNVQAWTSGSSSDFALVGVKSGTAPYDVAITDFVNGSAIYVTMTYFV